MVCKEDIFCKDMSINILLFIRRFLDYIKDFDKAFEKIKKCINIKLLITKLFDTIMNRYDASNEKWSNTLQLIFLWTIYQCKQNEFIDDNQTHKLLKWTESIFSWNDLVFIFNNKGMESFADFTDELYKYNIVTALLQNKEEIDINQLDSDDDDNKIEIMEDLNNIADDDLFVIDDLNDNEPPKKKQKISQ